MDKPFDPKLVDALVKQEMHKQVARDEFMPDVPEPRTSPKPLSPKVAMMLGGLADAASTLTFLKRGTAYEANPAFQYFNKHPMTVIPTTAAMGIGYQVLHKLIARKSPKAADTLAGLLGGYQMSLGGTNMEQTFGRKPGNAYEIAMNKIRRVR